MDEELIEAVRRAKGLAMEAEETHRVAIKAALEAGIARMATRRALQDAEAALLEAL